MTYHYLPREEYEAYKLERILKQLEYIVQREENRHEMDEHLTFSMQNLLKDEIIPMLEEELNYDPTATTAYDFFHQ